MTYLTLSHVSKAYKSRRNIVPVLDDVSLSVRQGELLTILGASGGGKSTLLRLIAGFLQPDTGDILLDGLSIKSTPPEKRGVVMIFQEDQLFPFMNVADNVAYGLKLRRVTKYEIKRRVVEMLALVRLSGYEHRKPAELSGGERQRVALARALAIQPRLLLLDEPFSNLDANLRDDLRAELVRLQRLLGITTILVTHDRAEAFTVADRIALLMDGHIAQAGCPRELYEHPHNARIAQFFGTANLLLGKKYGSVLEGKWGAFRVENATFPDGIALAMIRPEAVQLVDETSETMASNFMHGVIERWQHIGEKACGIVRIDQQLSMEVSSPSYQSYRQGEHVNLAISPQHIWLMPA